MAKMPTYTDDHVDSLLRCAVDMATTVKSLREFLAIEDGGGATVVRIADIRKIFAWQNDLPIRRRPKP